MLTILTAVVFISVAAGTGFLVLRISGRRERALARIASQSEAAAAAAAFLPSPALIWRELVARIGSLAPASPKNAPRVKLRLIRAGFRLPTSPRTFYGIRTCATAVLALGALIYGIRSNATPDRVIMFAAAGVLAGWQLPMQILMIRVRRRKRAIEKALPNALDLLVVSVEAGLGLDQAMMQVAKELQTAYAEICEEFTVLNLEMRAGVSRTDALHNLADRTGVEDLKKLVAVLVQTDRFGTSIAASLRGHSDYMRTIARQRAEEKAAKLAVKLVFPIFFCILPSLFVVTIGPILTKLVRDLFPMIENM